MKHIKDFENDDFLGLWKSIDEKFSFNLEKTADIFLNGKKISGKFFFKYISSCESCVNCLEIKVGDEAFLIKQIDENGFFMTTEYGEIHLRKINNGSH